MFFRGIISLLPVLVQGTPAKLNARAPTVPDYFKPGVKWQIEINTPIAFDGQGQIPPVDARVWDIDMFDATDPEDGTNNEIAQLRQRQQPTEIFVICYFNGGAVNPTDPDRDSFNGATLKGLQGWPGELYVDITNATVVKLMQARIDRGVQGGCDAFDPDNIDGYLSPENVTRADGHALDEADYYGFMKALSDYAHGKGKLLGQKNAPDLLDLPDGSSRGLLKDGITDFAVTEGCAVDADPGPWCQTVHPYIDAGKPVFQIEYPSEWTATDCSQPAPLTAAQQTKYCQAAGAGNFSTIFKLDGTDCGLDGRAQYCGTTVAVETPTEADT